MWRVRSSSLSLRVFSCFLIRPWSYSSTEKQPATAWQKSNPGEYGFYSNVNPARDHPRWSQKSERRLGEEIFSRRRPTLMFNGYAEQVASLYAGMDLMKFY